MNDTQVNFEIRYIVGIMGLRSYGALLGIYTKAVQTLTLTSMTMYFDTRVNGKK